MSGKNILFREAVQRDEDFAAFLVQEARSDAYLEAKHRIKAGAHPSDELLWDYAADELGKEEAGFVREHIACCGICAEEVLRIRLINQESEERLLTWADGEDHIGKLPIKYSEPPKLSLFEHVATELWEPQWAGAGQVVVAADIPEQGHTFRTENGNIEILCYWRGKHRKKPAYIRIVWKANMTIRNEMRARFVNPETEEIRSEVPLGSRLAGEEIFTSKDLGFDPSCERWAIAIILQETTNNRS